MSENNSIDNDVEHVFVDIYQIWQYLSIPIMYSVLYNM